VPPAPSRKQLEAGCETEKKALRSISASAGTKRRARFSYDGLPELFSCGELQGIHRIALILLMFAVNPLRLYSFWRDFVVYARPFPLTEITFFVA